MLELRIVRIRAGLSMCEAARRLGISQSVLSRIEHGHKRNISADLVVRMSSIYGLTTDEILRLVVPGEMAVTA